MTKKEKLWKKIVRTLKAEAKQRYEVGDRIYTPYNSGGGYRIHRGSVYRVHFDEAGDYDSSWFTVTVSDSKTSVVAVVLDAFGINHTNFNTYWDCPIAVENHRQVNLVMTKEIADDFKAFVALGQSGFIPDRKPY